MRNKILTVFLIVVLISFCFINNCFAFTKTHGSYTFYLPDKPYETMINLKEYNSSNYKFVAYCGGGKLFAYFFPVDMNIKIWKSNSEGGLNSNYEDINNFNCILYIIEEANGSLISTDKNKTTFAPASGTDFSYYTSGSKHYCYSSVNIYTDSSCSSIFFQGPPATLEEIMKQAGEQATQEVGQKILVVIVATVGLIIFVIGLKKGLTALMNGLKN